MQVDILVLFLGYDGILKKHSVNTITLSVLALSQESLLTITTFLFAFFQQAAVETTFLYCLLLSSAVTSLQKENSRQKNLLHKANSTS